MNPKYTIPLLRKHLAEADGKLLHILRETEDSKSPIFVVDLCDGGVVHSKYTAYTQEEGILILDGYEEVDAWQTFSICGFITEDELRIKTETQKKIQDAQPKLGIGQLLGQALGHPAEEEPSGTKQ